MPGIFTRIKSSTDYIRWRSFYSFISSSMKREQPSIVPMHSLIQSCKKWFNAARKPWAPYLRATLIVSIGGLLNGLDTGTIGPVTVMSSFVTTFGPLSATLHGLVISSILLTATVGSLCAGNLSDSLGRTRAISLGALIFAVGAALEAGSVNLAMLIAGRSVLGLGEGLFFSTLVVFVVYYDRGLRCFADFAEVTFAKFRRHQNAECLLLSYSCASRLGLCSASSYLTELHRSLLLSLFASRSRSNPLSPSPLPYSHISSSHLHHVGLSKKVAKSKPALHGMYSVSQVRKERKS